MFSILPSTLCVYLESSLLPSALTLLHTSHSTNFLLIQITLYHSVSPISLSPLSVREVNALTKISDLQQVPCKFVCFLLNYSEMLALGSSA